MAVRVWAPWQLILIVDDLPALKVAAAYYSLPKKERSDLDKLSDASGVTQDVRAILTRLDAAGMLASEPPEVLIKLINKLVVDKMR